MTMLVYSGPRFTVIRIFDVQESGEEKSFGYEILDKFLQKELFLPEGCAAGLVAQMKEMQESGASCEDVDDALCDMYGAVMIQPLSLH